MMDKGWLQLNRATDEYMQKAWNFVKMAEKEAGYPEKILCPCRICRNLSQQLINIVYEHLVIKGMDPTYTIWFHHGEEPFTSENVEDMDMSEAYNLFRAANFHDDDYMECEESRDEGFSKKLEDAEAPLFPGCTDYTKLSAIVTLYKQKTANGWSDKSFSQHLKILHGMLPRDNALLTSMYNVKKFLQTFDLGYEKIHACVNDCCLFRKDKELLTECPKCHASRWKVDEHTKKARVGHPAKVLRYFPIIPRIKRMFKSEKMAENLRWHFNNKSVDGKMRHPVNSVAWESVNEKWPSFSNERRNLRFGLSTDGFNPYRTLSSKYSCWPVMLVVYNLPPWLCMKRENILLTLLIPGPRQPGNDIDIYLEPLIDDLKQLWSGVDVHDVLDSSRFTLRAILLWTISDFPAYGNLAGCTTKGRKACPLCGEFTHSQWLKCSKKFAYTGHRKFLSVSHSFRRKKYWFDGKEEQGRCSRIMSGKEVFEYLKDFKNEWGKNGPNKQTKIFGKITRVGKGARVYRKRVRVGKRIKVNHDQRWKKRSIFFELPYWQELELRHNLDVMHIEKNVCESIINTLLDVVGKSKDGLNARKDLQEMRIRPELHPQVRGTRTYLPASLHTLSRGEKQMFCKRLFDLKLPDGYSSNISNCVSMGECKLSGLKSHDCHILMQQLLPVAIRGLMPKGPRDAIIKLCVFFNNICQRAIDREKLMEYEDSIAEILCMFERYFPPSFFDIMIHLVIHLGREVRLCGPVQFRWMYPFERYMKILKGYVRNPAKPEGCIAEGYLPDECMSFVSEFIKGPIDLKKNEGRNEEFCNGVILEGRPISAGKLTKLSNEMLESAHRYVLFNMAITERFIEKHKDYLRQTNNSLRKNTSLLWKKHVETFAAWLKEKVSMNSMNDNAPEMLRLLAHGPKRYATSYSGYIINGQRFGTREAERSTQNSGVSLEATTMCRSSAKDMAQVIDVVAYYGVLQDIILLDYHAFQIPVFKCDWTSVPNGVKIEDGLTLVNLHQGQNQFVRDPFILASQAQQVFYSRDDDSSNWYAVLKAPPRGFYELEKYEEHEDRTTLSQENPRIEFDIDDMEEGGPYVREDCEGIFI